MFLQIFLLDFLGAQKATFKNFYYQCLPPENYLCGPGPVTTELKNQYQNGDCKDMSDKNLCLLCAMCLDDKRGTNRKQANIRFVCTIIRCSSYFV